VPERGGKVEGQGWGKRSRINLGVGMMKKISRKQMHRVLGERIEGENENIVVKKKPRRCGETKVGTQRMVGVRKKGGWREKRGQMEREGGSRGEGWRVQMEGREKRGKELGEGKPGEREG
jgi:hypothetical protein